MSEPEIGLADGGELNFDKSLLQFNAKKIIYVKSSSQFSFKRRILHTARLSNQFTTIIMPASH